MVQILILIVLNLECKLEAFEAIKCKLEPFTGWFQFAFDCFESHSKQSNAFEWLEILVFKRDLKQSNANSNNSTGILTNQMQIRSN